MKKFLVIDGFGLIFKSYYAFIKRPLTNKDGENTSAIFGFFRSLLVLLKRVLPDYYVIALEGKGECFRNTIYPDYKANRDPTPEDLVAQIPKIISLIEKMEIPYISVDTFEADDVIGTLSETLSSGDNDIQTLIYSSDKDLRQLVNEKVMVYHPQRMSNDFRELTEDAVLEMMGVTPSQVIDYLALVGDTSDNIPGVKGVGPKTATNLLKEWGTLETIYENIENIKSKTTKKKLEACKDNAFLSQKLATIEKKVPFDFTLLNYESKALALKNAFNDLKDDSLNGIITSIQDYNKEFFSDIFHAKSAGKGEIPEETADGYKRLERDYDVICDPEKIKTELAAIKQAGVFCFDLETTGFDFLQDKIISIGLAYNDNAFLIPVFISDAQKEELGIADIDVNAMFDLVRSIFEDETITKIAHNIKFDVKFLKTAGIETSGPLFDTMLAEYCIDASHNILSMDDLALKYLHYKTIHYKDVVANPRKETLQDVSIDDLSRYAGEDIDITLQLYEILKGKLDDDDKIKTLFYDIEMPLVRVLIDMEYFGVAVDKEYMNDLSATFEKEIEIINKQIIVQAGEEFNPNSTKQLKEILFTKLDLPVIKKTKTGPSTDVEVLQKLAAIHPIAGMLLNYRALTKIKSTYSDALPELINEASGKIHTTYMQTGTQTGRLSSKTPNLQNIPVKTKIGNKIRQGFIPRPGNVLISADYSQIELFLLAEFSRDEKLFEAFKTGADIHSKTAGIIFGKELADITKEERTLGKTINFSILYGQGAHRLSENLKISRKEAAHFISLYFEGYAGIRKYMDDIKESCREHGFVKTHWGRKRTIPEINDKNKMRQANGERMAVNTTIQGTAADLMKISMIKIWNTLKERKLESKIIMQVHDELIFDVPAGEQEEVMTIIKDCMENGFDFELNLKTSVKAGNNWGELK